jgi:hypothetical protein
MEISGQKLSLVTAFAVFGVANLDVVHNDYPRRSVENVDKYV